MYRLLPATMLALLLMQLTTNGFAADKPSTVVFHHQQATGSEDLCAPTFCADSQMHSANVMAYCGKNKYTAEKRCCVQTINSTTVVRGLDYTGCQVDSLSTALTSLNANLTGSVQIIDLSNNTFIECNSTDAFAGFLDLQQLFKPTTCACPGGNYSWASITDNACASRQDLCNTGYVNSNCTQSSQCSENGPGNLLCLCKDGFHGYKCLNQDGFPSIIYTVSICVSGLFLCGLFWHTQRRNVKND